MATSKSFNQFGRRMKLRAKEFEVNGGVKLRRAALRADQVVVVRTPFDTGRAKANWITSLNTPIFEELDAPSKGDRAVSERISINQGTGVIGRFRFGKDSRIFITNSLPYIEELENGSSDQAPEGMAKLAILAAQAEFRIGKVFKRP